jgi:hypothetical protein
MKEGRRGEGRMQGRRGEGKKEGRNEGRRARPDSIPGAL